MRRLLMTGLIIGLIAIPSIVLSQMLPPITPLDPGEVIPTPNPEELLPDPPVDPDILYDFGLLEELERLATPPPAENQVMLPFPIRAAFYYPWYPETWGMPVRTHYNPTRGFYNYDVDPVPATPKNELMVDQINEMTGAKIQAGIGSWWGKGTLTDMRIDDLLRAAEGTNFGWTLYYEQEGYTDPTEAQIRADLTHIRLNYSTHPNYLWVNTPRGPKPVLFVYNANDTTCSVTERWVKANTPRTSRPSSIPDRTFFLVMKVFDPPGPETYRDCPFQPQSWHQYVGDKAFDNQVFQSGGQSVGAYTISPGFWKWDQTRPLLQRDYTVLRQSVRNMVAKTNYHWHLIVSYNEWQEGTQIEPSQELGNKEVAAILANDGAIPASSVVMGAGDISCRQGSPAMEDECRQGSTAQLILNEPERPDVVLTFGDNQYDNGELSNYLAAYHPSWGEVLDRTRPSPGNHEYISPNQGDGTACSGAGALPTQDGYFDYYGSIANPIAGSPQCGYFSFDVDPGWHFISLNSECADAGGCGVNSPQWTFLQNDLLANTESCVAAYWHIPRYSVGNHGDAMPPRTDDRYRPFWDRLLANRADLVLNGHDHSYQQFGPQNIDGAPDPNGLRQFVVGTGGKNLTGIWDEDTNGNPADDTASQTFELANGTDGTRMGNVFTPGNSTFGVFKLTLRAGGYSWDFRPDLGSGTFTAAGSADCRV